MTRATVIVFDVNETLSDMSPLANRFADVGASPGLLSTWFAGLLRDGFALTVSGVQARFTELATEGLRTCLAGSDLTMPLDAAVSHILEGFGSLRVHPDVPDGVRALRASGYRLVTLTNGSAATTELLLRSAGLLDEIEMILSVDDAGIWKPAGDAYGYAAARCGVSAADMMMVAVHPWDIDGAVRAGLRAAWIDRAGSHYPEYFSAPDFIATSVSELAEHIRAR